MVSDRFLEKHSKSKKQAKRKTVEKLLPVSNHWEFPRWKSLFSNLNVITKWNKGLVLMHIWTKNSNFEQKYGVSNKKLPWGKSFVGLNEIFLELWSNNTLPSCHHCMDTSKPPLLCSLKLLQGTEVCRARASPYDQIIICPGRQSNTAWEHELCIQQNQTSACHWSPPFGDGCGSIYVSYNVVRSLTQHMENLWSRLTSNPQALTQRVSVLARSSERQKPCLALLGKTLCRKQLKY